MKKHLLKISIAIILTLICNVGLFAQKPWTLEECIGYALENNIQIKRQQLQADVSSNNLTQSYVDLAPNLSANGQHSIGSGYNVDIKNLKKSTTQSSGNLGLNSEVTIFNGLQKINTIRYNKFNFLKTKSDLEKTKNDISLSIASGYLQVLFSKELLDVAKSQQDVTKLRVDKTEKLVEVGSAARGDLLNIKAQAAAEEANVVDAQNQLNMAYISLAQMLDLDTVKNFKIYTPDTLIVPTSFYENPDSVYSIALQNLPQIKSSIYGLKGAERQLAISRGARSPYIYVSASLTSWYDAKGRLLVDTANIFGPTKGYPIKDQISDNYNKSISVGINIPIFTRFQTQTRISNAKLGVRDAELNLRQSQIQLRKEIEQAHADALAAFEKYKSQQENVAANEESFKYVQQKFDVGMVNSVDYNVAKNNYLKAQSDLLQAKYTFIFKTKILDFYKGNPIRL